MNYFVLISALGIVLLFGFWSGRRRLKSQRRQAPKQAPKAYPLSGAKRQTTLRRVK